MPPEQKPEEKIGEPKIEKPKSIIQTYAGDMADAIKEQQGSVLKVVAAEEERRAEAEKIAGPLVGGKKRFLIFAGLGVVILIMIIGAIFYFKNSTPAPDTTETPQAPQIISLIKAENHTAFNTTNKTPQVVVADFRALVDDTKTVKGTVEDIYPYITDETGNHLLGAPDFLFKIGSSTPGELTRVVKKQFMLGINKHTDGSPQTPFVILKTVSYTGGFSGMLEWENTLFDDMAPLFGIDTKGVNAYLLSQPWSDTTIKNKDSRAILDSQGIPVLFYTFLDDTTKDEATLIITKNADTLSEVINRFFQNPLKR